MNNEKSFFSLKKNNDCFQWKQTDGDMIFYNCKNKNQNFPLVITFTKSNSNTFKNNISNKSQNEEGNKDFIIENEELKQNFNIDDFCNLLKKKKQLLNPKIEIMDDLIKNKPQLPQEINSLESLNSKQSNLNKKLNESINELNENESVDKLIIQLSNIKDIQIKSRIIKELVIGRKKLHKEKLENFYIQLSKVTNEKIEDVKDWISLEEKLMRIENLSFGICKELKNYIKVLKSGKIQLDNISSKDFLRVHFIGSIKVKINDFNLTLKNY